MNTGTLKQILLITDGCSNSGEDPVSVARDVYRAGITINVIGVLEDGATESSEAFREIQKIADVGGGINQVVYQQDLSQTVQTVTRQAMHQTIQGFVQAELSHIFGEQTTVEAIAPEKRGEVVRVVEEIEEVCALEVLILIDTSASMHHKLPAVQEALIDLSINLQARVGMNHFAIYQFPARKASVSCITDWAEQLHAISHIFPQLVIGGVTPTGPALREAMRIYLEKDAYDEGISYDN